MILSTSLMPPWEFQRKLSIHIQGSGNTKYNNIQHRRGPQANVEEGTPQEGELIFQAFRHRQSARRSGTTVLVSRSCS